MAIELPKRVAENIDRFTGRAWLLPRILKWWDKRDDRLFLLAGGPGTGKSMILAWLAGHGPAPTQPEARFQLKALREVVKAVHFCQAASRNVTPQAFAESVANTLTDSVKGFADALSATLAERVSIVGTARASSAASGSNLTGVMINRIDLGTLGDELSFDRAFTQPLKKLYACGHSEPMLLLIDALDEAQTYTGQVTLPDLLSRLADLPPQVRLLATTRDEPRVLKFFREVKPFDLIKDADPDVDDVRTYAEGRLADLTMIEADKRGDFAQRLSTQAGGVFLYAAMVLDELLARPPSALPALDSYPLPKGLSGLYHAFLTRELGRDDSRWFDLYEPLLGLIAVAQGDGLTTQQLADLVGKDVRASLRACKQYLTGELPGGPFRPFHKTFADFLLDDPNNTDFHIDPASMHHRIAEHYWSRHSADWSQCDDYGLDSLAFHLHEAEQFDRLGELIRPQRMEARVKRKNFRYSGFVADLRLALQHAYQEANRQIETNDTEFSAFANCFRYALIRNSINSLSANYSPALVKRALETGLWNAERALDVAVHVPRANERALMYVAILEAGDKTLTDVQRNDSQRAGLAAARALEDEGSRACALAALAPQLGVEAKTEALSEALAAARAINAEFLRAEALTSLASRLCGEEKTVALAEALAAARAIESEWGRTEALTAMMPQLTGEAKNVALVDAMAAARAIGREGLAQRLATLVPHLSGEARTEVLGEALELARAIEDRQARVDALAALSPHLSGDAKAEILDEALAAARVIESEWLRKGALMALAPHISGAQLGEALELARAIGVELFRAQTLTSLASKLCGEEKTAALAEALVAAGAIEDERDRARMLIDLASQVTGAQAGEVLAAVRAVRILGFRARALAKLAPQLRGAELSEALAGARGIGDEASRTSALAALAPRLSGKAKTELLREALELARAIEDGEARVDALAALSPQLSGDAKAEILDEALATARELKLAEHRVRALMVIVPQLSSKAQTVALNDTLAAVRTIDNYRSYPLTALVPLLSGEAKIEVVGEALTAARAMEEGHRARVLVALAPELHGVQIDDALAMARAIGTAVFRARALAAVASQLRGEVKIGVVEEALTAARAAASNGELEQVLPDLSPQLGCEQLDEMLSVARKCWLPKGRVQALTALAPRLRGEAKIEVVGEALAAAGMVASEKDRAESLAALAPHVSCGQLDEVLAAVRVIEDDERRLDILFALPRNIDYRVVACEIRRCLLACLDGRLAGGSRATLLKAIIRGDAICAPIMGAETAAAIAGHIIDIGHRWRWI